MSDFLECGHPKACLGLNATNDPNLCGWCADIKDLSFIVDNVSEVYGHITGGQMSKPNYYAKDVIARADEYYRCTENEDCETISALPEGVVRKVLNEKLLGGKAKYAR